jgi:hypothetical protein
MKINYLFVAAFLVVASGCASVYRYEQMPDDLYFVPNKPAENVLNNGNNGANYQYAENANNQPTTRYNSSDDNYLRMKSRNYNRWSTIDDYSYWNDSRYLYNNYSFDYYNMNRLGSYYSNGIYNPNIFYNNCWGCGYGYGNYFYPSYYGGYNYNNWRNPYHTIINYGNHTYRSGNTSSNNIKAFSNNNYNNRNYAQPNQSYNTTNNQGKTINRPLNTPTNNTYYTPARTYDPASSPSRNSGGNSGGFRSIGSSADQPRRGR